MNGYPDWIDQVDQSSFAYQCMLDRDAWRSFTPVFGSLTVVGATSYSGRLREVGKKCEFHVQFSAATSIASVAGTDYLNLPLVAQGFSGLAVMSNKTTNIAVGNCHIDVANNRCYLPTQGASSNTFVVSGSFEI